MRWSHGPPLILTITIVPFFKEPYSRKLLVMASRMLYPQPSPASVSSSLCCKEISVDMASSTPGSQSDLFSFVSLSLIFTVSMKMSPQTLKPDVSYVLTLEAFSLWKCTSRWTLKNHVLNNLQVPPSLSSSLIVCIKITSQALNLLSSINRNSCCNLQNPVAKILKMSVQNGLTNAQSSPGHSFAPFFRYRSSVDMASYILRLLPGLFLTTSWCENVRRDDVPNTEPSLDLLFGPLLWRFPLWKCLPWGHALRSPNPHPSLCLGILLTIFFYTMSAEMACPMLNLVFGPSSHHFRL